MAWQLQCSMLRTKVCLQQFWPGWVQEWHLVPPSLPPAPVGQDAVQIAAPLFLCSGELGDTNALYTYAQLLRTGG